VIMRLVSSQQHQSHDHDRGLGPEWLMKRV
jgi:hypothetical protein